MATEALSTEALETLLEPYLAGARLPGVTLERIAKYLDLLLLWNARTNLTAIRTYPEIVKRHFGESLFLARQIGEYETLLDFGSGAGFPGLPIQLLRPELRVTLAESQGKKAAFLHEVVRSLELNTRIWAHRVETMPKGCTFDVTTMRAVDNMEAAVPVAAERTSSLLAIMSTSVQELARPTNFLIAATIRIPQTDSGHIVLLRRSDPVSCST